MGEIYNMIANTIIHTIDVENNICVVSLYDDGDFVLNNVNIGIDVSGNTTYITNVLKNHLVTYRRHKMDKDVRI